MRIGDIVMLNSGGPKMTYALEKEGMCWCVWFRGSDLCKDYFVEETLKVIQSGKPVLRIPKLL